MRRHSLIGRIGAADTATLEIHAKGSIQTVLQFVEGKRQLAFGIGQIMAGLRKAGISPSEVGVDLVILAALVTAADTRISRQADSQDTWTREIDLYVPVSRLDSWLTATPLIERILAFLTGDRWRIFFRQRHDDFGQLVTSQPSLEGPRYSSVCLFSGGLDSLIGAIDLVAAAETPLLVSHYWDLSTVPQEYLAGRIANAFPENAPGHVRARVGFDKNDFAREMGSEPTTRGRSFLFFSLAALAASGFTEGCTIYVPENGLISLNVPLDPLRVGAWSTRTTHPFYMARWNDLLAHLGINSALENPYRFTTKGEMLRGCAEQELLQAQVRQTISCSSISKARWAKHTPGHCGFCVPCLIRRAAIASALPLDPTTYVLSDLNAQPLNANGAQGEHIRSFQHVANRLGRDPQVARILVHKTGPLTDYTDSEVAEYAAVFRRGVEEVARLTRKVVVRPS